jgi:hypothetical protein
MNIAYVIEAVMIIGIIYVVYRLLREMGRTDPDNYIPYNLR